MGGLRGAFELSVTNADKGVLPMNEILKRSGQFSSPGASPFPPATASLRVLWVHRLGSAPEVSPHRLQAACRSCSRTHRCL